MRHGIITNAVNWRSRKLQGKCKFQGLPISIENERGSYRQGIDPSGKKWFTPFLNLKYGYVRGTTVIDDDALDVYIGPHSFSTRVFVINQVEPKTRRFDELKCMLGFESPEEAKMAYLNQYDSLKYLGSMVEMDMAEFKSAIKTGLGKRELHKALFLQTSTDRAMMDSKLSTNGSEGHPVLKKTNRRLPVKFPLSRSVKVKTSTLKSSPDGALRHSEVGSDFSNRDTLGFHFYSGVNIPSDSSTQMVKARMIGSGKKLKIFKPVVKTVSVDMVDNLSIKKGATDMATHDVPMFEDLNTINGDESVSDSRRRVGPGPSSGVLSSHIHGMSPPLKLNKFKLEKAKYIRRWRGKDGRWYYEYRTSGAKREKKVFSSSEYYKLTDDPNVTKEVILNRIREKYPDVDEKLTATEARLSKVTPTIKQFRTSGEGASAVYSAERQTIHNDIIRKIISSEKIAESTPPPGPVMVMLGGRGGSGKSWFEGKVYNPDKALVLDSDEIKKMLPEYEGWNAFEVHEESNDILEKVAAIATELGLNVVFDATLKTPTSAVERARSYKGRGYQVELHYMHLPRQMAAERAVNRFMGPTGRYVPIDVILGNTRNEESFEEVKKLADDWSFNDSRNPNFPPPKIVARGPKPPYEPVLKAKDDLPDSHSDAYDFYDFGPVTDPADYAPDVTAFIAEFLPKIQKSKYIRRWRKDGKWHYKYPGDKVDRKPSTKLITGTLPGMSEPEIQKLLKDYRRRAPGDGREKTIQKPEHLDAILRRSTFCMMSAGRNPEDPEDMKLSDAFIRFRYNSMLSDLKKQGYVFTRCRGKYVNAEESVMVMCHDADRSDMMEIGRRYRQDSIVFSEEGRGSLIYTTGEKAGKEEMAGMGYKVVPQANDFYTKMPLANGNMAKFTINLGEIVKALRLLKASGSKYIRKYFKNGRWNYVYPENGGKRPRGIGAYATLKNMGGSTGGALHVHLANGEEKVLKRSTSESHLRDEYIANRIYKTLGVSVPNVQLSRDNENRLVQVADYIEGIPLGDLQEEEAEAAREQLKSGFIADALLGNWDVLGLDNDNVLWDGSKAWRIDNGGALRFRAQGAPKGDQFGADVTEVDSLRSPSRKVSGVFGSITDEEIRDQVSNVLAKKGTILAGIEDSKLRKTMEQRITNLVDRYGTQKSIDIEGGLIKSRTTNQWYLLEKGKPVRFFWLGELRKAEGPQKTYYSADEIKARGMRWVTIRGARALLQGTADGGYVVVGGAGGKLSHLKVDNIMSKEDYKVKRKQVEEKRKEATQKLTKEEIAEAAQKRKEQHQARKVARRAYTEAVTGILGVTPEEIRENITANQMKELEDKARQMIENRKAAKTIDKKAIEKEIDKQTEKEVDKAINRHIRNVERDALKTLMKDYMPEDPNASSELENLLDKDKALEILAARKQFRKAIKEIGKESADIPTDLKVGAVFAAATESEMEDIQKQIKEQIETSKNIQMYDMLNAQSISINKHVDQGAISALNGLIGDVYGSGATFTSDTVKELGIEAVARAVTAKIQMDGKGEIVQKALEEYVATEREKVVDRALEETKKRLKNADDLRALARDTNDAEAILSMASANGHALKQITAAQRALGTAVGSLRAAAHMLNALEDPPADVIQVDMGKDLARARDRAKAAGLVKGTYQIRTIKKGRGKRLVMEIPKESLNNFFQGAAEMSARKDRMDRIKALKENDGYLPPGMNPKIKLDAAQEAGLRFFNEKGRVLLDFEAGIGKTGIAYAAIMDAMANKGAKKILVVTPSATRGDFHRQRETFLDKDKQKLVRQSTSNTSRKERHARHLEAGEGIHIVSQDSLREDASVLKAAGYDMVVLDEIHEMTAGSGASGRYKALDQLKDVPYKIGMSGTNIKSSKKELYRKVDFIDPEHTLGSMASFEKRYQGLNQGTGIFQDASNDAFRKELGDWVYTQKNHLPIENRVNTLKVPMSPAQRKAYAASERQYRQDRDNKVPGASAQRDSRNYAILSNGAAGGSNAKVSQIIDTMKNFHPGEKAVIHVSQPGKPVLSAMRTAYKQLEQEFGAGSVGMIHGETGPGELAKLKEAFNDPENSLRFIVGTKSLESGHNLQHGGSVTFHLDIPDSASAFDQRNARVFRKGQNKDTSTYVLSGVNPMDMRSEDLMDTKRKEMSIINNPRSVSALDDTGFIGLLNKYEAEARNAKEE